MALEKRDIADLERTRSTSACPRTCSRSSPALLNASQHHLAAFEAAADGQALGLQNGQGRRNGMGPGRPGPWATASATATGNGMGTANGMGNGTGPGQRAGPGLGDCPMLTRRELTDPTAGCPT